MSAPEELAPSESEIRKLHAQGDMRRAATLVLEHYGRELFGFLMTRLRDYEAAAEVFADFTEDLWRGIDGFRWQCSVRVWCYTLARHAASRYKQQARRRSSRNIPLSEAGVLAEIAEHVRTETAVALRTETKNRIAQLREQLPIDDQTLLILRVNRQLQWLEIAQIMAFEGEAADETRLKAEAARLRKRFQLAKERLRQMAREAGLVGDSDP